MGENGRHIRPAKITSFPSHQITNYSHIPIKWLALHSFRSVHSWGTIDCYHAWIRFFGHSSLEVLPRNGANGCLHTWQTPTASTSCEASGVQWINTSHLRFMTPTKPFFSKHMFELIIPYIDPFSCVPCLYVALMLKHLSFLVLWHSPFSLLKTPIWLVILFTPSQTIRCGCFQNGWSRENHI